MERAALDQWQRAKKTATLYGCRWRQALQQHSPSGPSKWGRILSTASHLCKWFRIGSTIECIGARLTEPSVRVAIYAVSD
jgi:hypothetical protein